jgi:hypothetical protein
MIFSGLASKLLVMVSLGWASKPVARVSRFGSQNQQLRFDNLGHKITAMVSWFGHQNQAGFGLSVVPQNRRREDGGGHVSRSSGLLCLEPSHARVSQSGMKTGGGTTVGGARSIIAEVTWSSSRRWMGR